ncbi:MAG: OmpA family protein [Pseudomonadota bacterium]
MSVNKKEPETKGSAWATMDWPGYILFLLLSGGLVYYALSPNSKLGFDQVPAIWSFAEDAAAPAAEVTEAKTEAAPEPEAEAAAADSSAFDGTLPSGTKIEFAAGGVEEQLVAFITDDSKVVDKKVWFDFDRLNFKTGSADLTDDSMAQVQNIYEILTAYPAVAIKIGGYTDNTGDAELNKTLSASRAQTVHAKLISLGIDASRLASEGYGDQHAVASNDTEEGRAKNRRIAVSVRAK